MTGYNNIYVVMYYMRPGIIIVIAIVVIVIYVNIQIYNKRHQSNITGNSIEHIDKIVDEHLNDVDETVTDNKDLRDFLFSIRDFYYFNPNAYNEVINNLKIFMRLYDDLKNDNDLAGVNLEKMETYKRESVNSLNSIIFTLHETPALLKKHQQAVDRLEDILLVVQNNAQYIYDKHLHKTGYTNRTKLVNLGPKPSNSFDLDSDRANINDKYSYSVI